MHLADVMNGILKMAEEAQTEVEDAINGKKVAFTRARKKLQEIKLSCQDLRKKLSELKKTL